LSINTVAARVFNAFTQHQSRSNNNAKAVEIGRLLKRESGDATASRCSVLVLCAATTIVLELASWRLP